METAKNLITHSEYLAMDSEGKYNYKYGGFSTKHNCWVYYLKKEAEDVKPHVTALAVDQAPEVRELGISYEDVARNLNNFAAVLRFLHGNCDKPDSRSLASLLGAHISVNTVIMEIRGTIEKQPELSLTPAADDTDYDYKTLS